MYVTIDVIMWRIIKAQSFTFFLFLAYQTNKILAIYCLNSLEKPTFFMFKSEVYLSHNAVLYSHLIFQSSFLHFVLKRSVIHIKI